jgi:hypothetical protein
MDISPYVIAYAPDGLEPYQILANKAFAAPFQALIRVDERIRTFEVLRRRDITLHPLISNS